MTTSLTVENAWTAAERQAGSLYDASHDLKNAVLVRQKTKAQHWVRASPFFIGASLRSSTGLERVYWLSAGDDPSLFAELNLVGPLTPIGRLVLRTKDAMKDGVRRSSTRAHSPWVAVPGGFTWESNGAVVDFAFREGITHADLHGAVLWEVTDGRSAPKQLHSPTEARARIQEAHAVSRSGFGLAGVVGSLDGFQLDKIDFHDDGPLFVTGAAGTGKTTVAFYRAAFLLQEQRSALEHNPNAEVFFKPDGMIALVRREHLKPYLAKLAVEVGAPGLVVKTFDEWFQENVFRPYLRGAENLATSGTGSGSRQIRFTLDVDPLHERWTASINETQISAYLDAVVRPKLASEYLTLQTAALACANGLRALDYPAGATKGRRDTLDSLRETWLTALEHLPKAPDIRVAAVRSHAERGLATLRNIRDAINQDTDLVSWRAFSAGPLERTISILTDTRDRIMAGFYRFDELAKNFYKSASALEALGKVESDPQAAQTALAAPTRLFSRADDVVLGWLIELLNDGSNEAAPNLQPLRRYDHIVLDEAQFYPPAIIRLLRRLARSPRRALTVVGDLDQRATESGLTDWRLLIAPGEEERLTKLDRIYRASKQIYAFLYALNERLGLRSTLEPPREVDRFESEAPRLVLAKGPSEEVGWIAGECERLRSQFPSAAIAIVLGRGAEAKAVGNMLRSELNALGVPAREARGEEIGERLDKVLITDADSVVGLEFDAVFIPRVSGLWPNKPSPEDLRTFWVCATRAKKFLAISAASTFPGWLGQQVGGVSLERVS